MLFICKEVALIFETLCFTIPVSQQCVMKTYNTYHVMFLFFFQDFSPHTRQKAIASGTDDFMKIVAPKDLLWRDPFVFPVVLSVYLCVCLCECNLIF